MIITDSLSPEQCKAARALLRLHQTDLCGLADITIKTLSDFEGGKTKPYASTIDKIKDALEGAGVEFINADNGGPGARLREAGE